MNTSNTGLRLRGARLLELAHNTLGDVVREDLPVGTSQIPVENAGDFRADQKVRISGFEDEYTVIDPTCRGERLSIDPALVHPADAGDPVIIWDKRAERASKVAKAKVTYDDDDGGDVVEVDVAHGLAKTLKPGVRDGDGEPVTILEDPTNGTAMLFDAPGMEDLDAIGGGGGGPAGAELIFSTGEVTNTAPSVARLITTSSAGVITRIVTFADVVALNESAVEILVNDEVKETVIVRDSVDVNIPVNAGQKVRVRATRTGDQNMTVVCIVEPGSGA